MPSPNQPADPLLGDQKPTIAAVLPASEGNQQDRDSAALKLALHPASPVARGPMSDPSALNATRLSDRQSLPLQGSSQRAAFDALNLALEEGNVFAALTGPAGTGKTTVLNAVLANPIGCKLRIIRLVDPHLVSANSAAHIEQVASAEAIKTENAEKHVVLTVEDAHAASDELMRCLTRLAAAKRAGARLPQLFIVGRPEFWDRLKAPEYEPLARRIAVRSVLEQAPNKPLSVPTEQEFTREAPSLHTAPSPDLDESRSIQAEAPPANTGVDF